MLLILYFMSLGCDSLVCVGPMTDEGVFVELIERLLYTRESISCTNLSMFLSSVELWMVLWCWLSLHKLSHSTDFSLPQKNNMKDLTLT